MNSPDKNSMDQSEKQQIFCSAVSNQAGEPLFATATHSQVLFLVEYNGVWGERAFEQSSIPDAVKSYLAEQVKLLPAARILLVKQENPVAGELSFFTAVFDQENPGIYEFDLPEYSTVLDLDLVGFVNGDADVKPHRRLESLTLVCTNGRRDACCAKFGLPVFRALLDQLGSQVWQCSHIGGHRFATNVIHLPDGVLYGRVTPEATVALSQAFREGWVLSEFYRGRIGYEPAAQAAEYHLRQLRGLARDSALKLFSVAETDPGRYRVRFLERMSGQAHQLILWKRIRDAQVYESCQLDKRIPITEWILGEYRIMQADPQKA